MIAIRVDNRIKAINVGPDSHSLNRSYAGQLEWGYWKNSIGCKTAGTNTERAGVS